MSPFTEFVLSLNMYVQLNWASLLAWAVLIVSLVIFRYYQVKWKKQRQLARAQRTVILVKSQISKDNLLNLKQQCDILQDLVESAGGDPSFNNQNIDKEVLELIYKMKAKNHSRGRTQNVD